MTNTRRSIDSSSGFSFIRRAANALVLGLGRRLPHFREGLPTGQMSTSLFFHFVAEDFEGDLR
jgi:hypothetical protein